MSTIGTTSYADPTLYPGQARLDRAVSTGYLYLVARTGSTTFQLYRSTNGGTSWAALGAAHTRTGLAEISNITVPDDGRVYIAYRVNESSLDKVYVLAFGLVTAAWGAEVLLSSVANGGSGGSIYTGVALVAVKMSSVTHIVVAAGHQSGASQGASLFAATLNHSASTMAATTSTMLTGTRAWWPTTGTGRVTPAVATQHNGDGHTAATPHLWLTFGRTTVKKVRCAWTGSVWSGPASPGTAVTTISAADYLTGRWDGSRFLMCYVSPADAMVAQVTERDAADSAYTVRNSPTHPQGNIRHLSLAVNSVSGDFRVYAIGTSNDRLHYVDFTRSGASWSSWTEVDTTAVLGPGNWGVREVSYGNARYDAYRVVSGSPNTIEHVQQTISYVPYAPTWVNVTGQPAEVSASLLLDWAFADPDPGDTQSAYAVSRQIGAGALAYWRASDSTWQATEQKNTSGTTSLTLASSWGADGDATHVYKVKVWDSTDVASSYSAPLDVVPSTAANPTLTAPTEGGTVTTPAVAVTWTVSQQTALRVTLTRDSQIVFDSGWVASATASYIPAFELEHGATYTVGLRTKNLEGLASAEDTNTFSVVFVGPAMPLLSITPIPASGVVRVVVTHPTPGPITFVAVGAADSDFGVGASVVPAMPSGWAPGDLLLIAAGVRNSGTGTVDDLDGWVKLVDASNFALLAREAEEGDLAPTVTFTGGLSNTDVLAQMAAWRGASTVASASATQLNGSAQNIDYPALTVPVDNQLIIIAGWKIDDWTSVDTLAGMTELGEPVSTGGDDEGIVWDYLIQTTKANISAGSFTVTGGAAGISRGVTVAIQPRPAVASVDLYRIPVAEPEAGVRLAAGLPPGPTWDDWHAAAATEYAYRAVASSTIGTSSSKTGLGQGQGYHT